MPQELKRGDTVVGEVFPTGTHAIIEQTVALLREYERHHRNEAAKATSDARASDRRDKERRNREAADRLDKVLGR